MYFSTFYDMYVEFPLSSFILFNYRYIADLRFYASVKQK